MNQPTRSICWWAGVAGGVFDRLHAEVGNGPFHVRFTAYLGVGVK